MLGLLGNILHPRNHSYRSGAMALAARHCRLELQYMEIHLADTVRSWPQEMLDLRLVQKDVMTDRSMIDGPIASPRDLDRLVLLRLMPGEALTLLQDLALPGHLDLALANCLLVWAHVLSWGSIHWGLSLPLTLSQSVQRSISHT